MTEITHMLMIAQGGGEGLWIGLILMLVVFYAIMLSGSRKEKKRRQEMLANIKKNDRVMTIGGIIGSVVSVNDSEVSLKVDESANVKITVIRSAIQRVLHDDERPKDLG
ncbi:MAG TPA: preprotein translocase subunit YajC [Phycisphaerae bacterium]|nr:preprotein translocase subunit YajC [Phycisphaerae bacterium]HOJ75613.1 preprotein translocase subunit YajC [Phycisphaerae bacterium]HOM50267.1 preprotein translocase subunit YajC [Phycisphaerae bacterium]HON66748.1 preprotein translocase subunit YajC [Phycisphaerae bacterium]HOQ85971.1 preprotein translocase subunit YajC [Phycisphaerae bacterium]